MTESTRKYYLSPFMIGMLILLLAMMSLPLLGLLLLLVIAGVLHLPNMSILLIMVLALGAPVAVIIWRLATPAVEISETGFKVSVPFLYKSNSATWDEIEGMTFGKIRTFLIPDKQLKILLKSEGSAPKEIVLSLRAVERPDEIVARLRERIPQVTSQNLKSKVLEHPVTKQRLQFRQWTLSQRGIRRSKLLVPWEDVKAISYSGLVIGGYGATTVTYRNAPGKEKSLIIKPKTSLEYLDCIRYLLQHASKASIDPGLIKVLEYPPADARADMTAAMLLIAAIALLFVIPLFMGAYSPTEGKTSIYPYVLELMALIPMGATIKLLAGRFRGKAEPASRKLFWSVLSGAVQITSVIVFLVLSPFSSYYVLGDISMKTGNVVAAEYWYGRALESIPDNIDVTFDMGLMYREKKEYERAFAYFEKAYTKNPKYLGLMGLELLPDTLLKMGKYDEAISWCDRILDSHPRSWSVQTTLRKKRDEIEAARAGKAGGN